MGLTLVEVLLAVAILGAGLTIMLTGAARCVSVMKVSKKYQEARWTLQRGELEYPVSVTNEIEDIKVSPQTYPNGLTFERDVDDEPTAEEEQDGLYVVRSKVTWTEKGRELSEELVRYVYHPAKK
jgi:Tfp pilus assembly protein PilV